MGHPTMKEVFAELNALPGWRALFVFPATATDQPTLIRYMPWLETRGQGVLTAFFQMPRSMVLLAGGALSDTQGAQLFALHAEMKHRGVRALIVPPETAALPLLQCMFDEGVQPAPAKRWSRAEPIAVLAALCLFGAGILWASLHYNNFKTLSALGPFVICVKVTIYHYWRRGTLESEPYQHAAAAWSHLVSQRRAALERLSSGRVGHV